MKILKAKKNYLNKQIFQISDLTYITRITPLKELLNGEDMIEPIEIMKHEQSENINLVAFVKLLVIVCPMKLHRVKKIVYRFDLVL